MADANDQTQDSLSVLSRFISIGLPVYEAVVRDNQGVSPEDAMRRDAAYYNRLNGSGAPNESSFLGQGNNQVAFGPVAFDWRWMIVIVLGGFLIWRLAKR